MNITDPIADLLTRIRNAGRAKHKTVEVPSSNMKKAIVKILLDEGFIADYKHYIDEKQGTIKITLKYTSDRLPVIKGIKRISKPGLRVYASKEELPRVLKGLGIAIISTSKGIMTDKAARRENVGGEVLAFVW